MIVDVPEAPAKYIATTSVRCGGVSIIIEHEYIGASGNVCAVQDTGQENEQ